MYRLPSYRKPDTRDREISGYTVKIETWSGNYRPYRARVLDAAGAYVGTTGGCASVGGAIEAARGIIAGHVAKARA